jgi:hypothetical protein
VGENRSEFHRRILAKNFLVIPVILLLVGCGTIRQRSFAEFTDSVQQFRNGADDALRYSDEANRTRFIEKTAGAGAGSEDADAVSNLLMETIPGRPFAWKMPGIPLFMVSPQFRSGVYALNSTLLAYSELLSDLADSDLVTTESFDAMAKDLNASLLAAAHALEFENAGKGIGIISAAASEAAHSYIDYRRRGMLKEVLEKNQPMIDDLSEKLQGAMRLAARNLRQNHEEQSKKLAGKLVQKKSVSVTVRRKTIIALMKLDEEYIARRTVLEALHNSYRALSGAHRELTEAVTTPGTTLASVQELNENGKYLHELFKDTQEENR